MCGLAGFFRYDLSRGAEAGRHQAGGREAGFASLDRMASAIGHRGPDSAGVWVSADGGVGLAHRRLTIVDLAETARQPMEMRGGACVVVYNGEIYNHLELRRTLTELGFSFMTDHSDTEVLLHGYAAWGLQGLLDRVRGMYAFALWDTVRGLLHLARDPQGIKPLYLYEDQDGLRFASEIKALLADGVPAVLNRPALAQYLTFLAAPAPETLFRGIAKMPAGHAGTWTRTGVGRIWRHWTPKRSIVDAADAVSLVRNRVGQAVASHMMADVPVGVFLSGGVDSTAVAALAARSAVGRLKAFTVGFSDHPEANETRAAASVAEELSAEICQVLISASDMEQALPALIAAQDEPLADWVCVPLYFVSALAKENGVKVVLTGEGADELFCGYSGYLAHRTFDRKYRSRLDRLPKSVSGLLALAARSLSDVSARADAFADLFRRVAHGQSTFWGGAIGFWPTDLERLMETRSGENDALPGGLAGSLSAAETVRTLLAQGLELLPDLDALGQITWLELQQRLPELLLMRVDKMTMAHGLEARVPFLDRDLVELALSLPEEVKVGSGAPKAVLKAALAGIVPQAVLDRPKQGFGAPMGAWLRESFGLKAREWVLDSPLMDEAGFRKSRIERLFAEHRSGVKDRSVQLWILTNLALWQQYWGVR